MPRLIIPEVPCESRPAKQRKPKAQRDRVRSFIRPANRRSSQAELEELRDLIIDTCFRERPLTVRGLYYRLVSAGAIEKTEQEYRRIVRITGEMRLSEDLPFEWLADSTRWQRAPNQYGSLGELLDEQATLYRRDLWREQEEYLEVWLEKDALVGVVHRETMEWGVPLMVCRGYASLSFLHSAAQTIERIGKPTRIYFLGDHDPSGLNIAENVERRIREFAPMEDVTFTRLAVTRDQIEEFGLPTRPTKTTDSRARNFEGESVELDAVPPAELRRLVRAAIEEHVDPEVVERLRRVEQEERATLAQFAKRIQAGRRS
jgi:hypothetical protein